MSQDLRMRMFTVSSGVYLTAAGRLDQSNAHLLRRVVDTALQRFGATTMALDVSEIRFVDTFGVAMLVTCRQIAQDRGVRFTLAHPSLLVRRAILACDGADLLTGALVGEPLPAPVPGVTSPARRGDRRICVRPTHGPRDYRESRLR